MPAGVGGDRRVIGPFLDDFAAGTRAIADYADLLDGLPDEELTKPAHIPDRVRRNGDDQAQAA